MDTASQWNLPPEFAPVRYAISDDAKNAMRGLLQPGEPVILTLSNESDTLALIGTPQRLFVIKTAQMGMTAMGDNVAAGAKVREFPWEGISSLLMTPMTFNVKFTINYRTSNGKTVEVGIRARMGKPAAEHLAPFESAAGEEAFAAMMQLWNFKRATASETV